MSHKFAKAEPDPLDRHRAHEIKRTPEDVRNHLDLVPVPVARHTDPETAHDAADHAAANMHSNTEKVLEALPPRGMTTEEITDATGLGIQITSTMMTKLEKAGLVQRNFIGLSPSGKRRYEKRKNRSGTGAIIWFRKISADAPTMFGNVDGNKI